jgi:hypothetical protein
MSAIGQPRLALGWREWVALPGMDIPRIKAKLDTGARSSALHVVNIRTSVRDGVDVVHFLADPDPARDDVLVSVRCPIVDERMVRASNGQEELRIVVKTDVAVAGQRWPIEVTLASRSPMRFRMLLGREALRGRATVDPAASYVAGMPNGWARDIRQDEEE